MFIPFNVTTLILKALFGVFVVFVIIEALAFGGVCLPILLLHWLLARLGLCKQEETEEDLSFTFKD